MLNAEGVVPGKGAPGFVPPQERPFAPQKAGLLPQFRQPEGIQPQGDELVQQTSALGANSHTPSSASSQSREPLVLPPALLADLTQRHLATGGSTTDLRAGRGLTEHDARYIVSPYDEHQLVLNRPPAEQDLRNFVAKHESLLTQPNHHLGTWFNTKDGKHYLDVSIGMKDLPTAIATAQRHKQLAIYDMLGQKEIRLPQSLAPPKTR